MIKRSLYEEAWLELSQEKSLVLLAGPRQCGKTTLAQMLSNNFTNSLYFNWDIITDKRKLIEDPYFFTGVTRLDESRPFIILDEIHKYKNWKNYLKGVYDSYHSEFQFLVSGSGRLDVYQKGGDSLAGRYRAMHLWPLTLAELADQQTKFESFRNNPTLVCDQNFTEAQAIWSRLSAYSGFPEPYLSASSRKYNRWSRTYHRQLLREDIRDMTEIKQIDNIEILFSLLPAKVGAPLSIPNLSNDLRTSYNTVKNWLNILDRFYLTFTITPWSGNISRAIHKEKKTYLFDYAGLTDQGRKFENMVALELFRAISSWTDLGYGIFSLHYIKTKEGREVDFLITENNRPILLIETKLGDDNPAPNLVRFQKALGIPAIQLLNEGQGYKRLKHNGHPFLIAPATYWIPALP